MAIVTAPWPDDASGEIFRMTLEHLRSRRPKGKRRAAREAAFATWEIALLPDNAPASREAFAHFPRYYLSVVEMKNWALMVSEAGMPKVSWSLCSPNRDGDPLGGGAAPTFEEAMARAEIALRVQLGVALDG